MPLSAGGHSGPVVSAQYDLERRRACQEYADFMGEPIEALFPEFKRRNQPLKDVQVPHSRNQSNLGGGLPVTGATTGGAFIRK